MSFSEPGSRKEAKLKVRPNQIWICGGRRVLVIDVFKGWVKAINEYGTMESYVVSKSSTGDQRFHGFSYVKDCLSPGDFPTAFKPVDKIK